MDASSLLNLQGKRALVTGIANEFSIAWGIARQLHAAGCRLAIAYLPDERDRTKTKVTELTAPLAPDLMLPLNVQDDGLIAAAFEAIAQRWEGLDILVHCLAFAKKEELAGNFTDISREGYALAMDVSAYSLIALCRHAKPLMTNGGSVLALTYLGGVRVIPNYNVMGSAKAALEMNVRYLAAELGPQNIRVNALSAGPIRTLASSAVSGIRDMIRHVEEVAPLRRSVTPVDVGNAAVFLASDLSAAVTGQILYVDSGYEILGA